MHAIDLRENITEAPEFREGRKIKLAVLVVFWQLCQEDITETTRYLWGQVQLQFGLIEVSVRYLNLLRNRWGLSRPKGRPSSSPNSSSSLPTKVYQLAPNVPFVGICLFDSWLEEIQVFDLIAGALHQSFEIYREEHPEDRYPLPHHRLETHKLHFQALFYAPLLGIDRLSEYDLKEHALPHIIGQNYHASTLKQALCKLEKVDAAQHLLPLLLPQEPGVVGYIDGHMVAFWSSKKMHKGHITMLGRVMGGSQAVVTHDQQGQVIYFEYHVPDLRLTHILVDYCKKLRQAAGIEVFIVDREANSLELARAFDEAGLGLLCMLSSNQYEGLGSFDTELLAYDEETNISIYRGDWKSKKKKESDSREFVLMESEQKELAYWGNAKVKEHFEYEDWPWLYRERTELQENSFKRMKAHGSLDVNYGTKVIMGPDRHQQRKREKLEQSRQKKESQLQRWQGQIIEQEEKVRESLEKGHTKRLESREKKLAELEDKVTIGEEKIAKVERKLAKVGPAKERGDRDFRKQGVMTFRTFLLENLLNRFFCELLGGNDWGVGMETLIELLFRRRGGYLEKEGGWEFWLDGQGLSESYRRLLEKLVLSVNKLQIQREGKPIQTRIRDGTS